MRILIAEDDQNKFEQLKNLIESAFPSAQIKGSKSYQSTVAKMLTQNFDVIVLDMTMPTFEITANEQGGPPLTFAGVDVLSQLVEFNKKTPVIVVTQFEAFGEGPKVVSFADLKAKLQDKFPLNFKGMIYFNSAQNTWATELETLLQRQLGESK